MIIKKCIICGKEILKERYCSKKRYKLKKYCSPKCCGVGNTKNRKCDVKGCYNKHYIGGYCIKHYRQIETYGNVIKRTRNDRNKIIKYKEYAEIILYKGKGNNYKEDARTKINIDDIEKVKNYKWHLDREYIFAIVDGKKRSLHSLILKPKKGFVIDHINRIKTDNRKQNLRNVTIQQNIFNSVSIGIRKRKNGSWRAGIGINDKHINLGSFKTKEEALKAREQAEIKYFGKFRNKEKFKSLI